MNVVIGLLFNNQEEALIALRPSHVVEPGVWEFPGGKVEKNETLENALIREYREEIGIEITRVVFLFTIDASPTLKLHVFRIESYTGSPRGCENQEIRFVPIQTLKEYEFPKANAEIIRKLTEPKR